MTAMKVHAAVVLGLVGILSGAVFAQEDTSIYGTHSVVFQPGQVGGVMKSCTLVYRTVQADRVYLDGSPVVAVGNIGVMRGSDGNLALTVKVGVKELNVPDSPIVAPHFAYLQTPSATTAKSQSIVVDGEAGYRVSAVELSDSTSKLIFEMLESGRVTIGFNRKEGGLDVLVPVDLKVFDAEYRESGEVVRKRSNDAVVQFIDCFQRLVDGA